MNITNELLQQKLNEEIEINEYLIERNEYLIERINELKNKIKKIQLEQSKLNPKIIKYQELNYLNLGQEEIPIRGKRKLNPQLAKYQELSKLVREYSTDKHIGPVSKAGKKAFEEAKKSYPADFMAQVDEAKRLFKANPNKYIT
jgi:predicted nuclease with TOPRIM domain